MANKQSRFYVGVPCDDGTGIIAVFTNQSFDPRLGIIEQLPKAFFWDKMPLSELYEVGTTAITTANASAGQYAEKVRLTKIRTMANNMVMEPADPEELAKWVGYLQGVNIDPSATPMQVQQALQTQHEAEEAPPQE